MIKGPKDVTDDRAWRLFTIKYYSFIIACCAFLAACAFSIYKML